MLIFKRIPFLRCFNSVRMFIVNFLMSLHSYCGDFIFKYCREETQTGGNEFNTENTSQQRNSMNEHLGYFQQTK
ncbi:unnamed protein product [Larinioides sclopetarius]|uniref:Uncharacterized protein n=1 Tax=Larinioides sclopetarius TaxID=280406 RepID=A0AAV1ZF53_9ARAC